MQGHENDCENEKKWGFDLSQLYLLAVKFYKEKEGKALQLSYAARMEFVSLTQQVAHGPCRPDTLPQLGVLDIVGRDRREAWQRLGDMSRPDSMVRYIEMLDAACPIFRPFAEAHRRDLEAQERRREEERAAEEQRRQADERERLQRELELSRQAETKRRIQDGLNRQTYGQFRVYASQQYPGNPEQQAVLIRKLQQQHYQQYMQQLYQHQHRQQQQQQERQQQQQQEQQQQAADPVTASDRVPDGDSMSPDGQRRLDAESTTHVPQLTSPSETDASDDSGQLKDDDIRRLAEAKMWIRGDLEQFKATIRSERTRGVQTVGQGQVVTVRVPARADGTCLFWEFATDGFDLGFGVWFEWGPTTQYEVTVEVSEGADEEQPPGEEGAVSSPGRVAEDRPARISCVVPVYRRDCHLHVYAGSHRFPAHESDAMGVDVAPAGTLQRLASLWGCDVTSAEMAQQLDQHDKLASFRNQFQLPKMATLPGVDLNMIDPSDEVIYMNGNSLGLMPRRTTWYCEKILQQWGDMGHETHFEGLLPAAKCDLEVTESHARLVGGCLDEVAVMNGLTVNLHLLLTAFYHPTPLRHKILIEDRAFPSDKYAVRSQVRRHGYDPDNSVLLLKRRPGEDIFRMEDVLRTIRENASSIAVIMIGGVHYMTGQKFDMEAITKVGHEAGCVVGFDLAHAVGNVKLELHNWNVDFACWCTYKYLNSGPGCIAGAFVNNRHILSHLPLLHGWWGNKPETRFHMQDTIDHALGVNSLKLCNPPQMLVAMNRASLDIFDQVSMDQLVQKQRLLTGYLELLISLQLPEAEQITPADPAQRGCQLSFRFSNAHNIHAEMKRRGVECDIRHGEAGSPNVMRLAPVPLYNSFTDVFRLVTILRQAFHRTNSSASECTDSGSEISEDLGL